MEIKVGDWVKSYSQGIWRAERKIENFYETRRSSNEPRTKSNRIIIISKRLVNDKWKTSFSVESCSLGFIQALSFEEQNTLNEFIRNNEKIMKDFEKFNKSLDLVLSFSFSIDDHIKTDFESYVNQLFSNKVEKGLTSDEIIEIIEKSKLNKYANKNPRNKTIQFISVNQEIEDSEFIYKNIIS